MIQEDPVVYTSSQVINQANKGIAIWYDGMKQKHKQETQNQ
jgi:hypothetical protein